MKQIKNSQILFLVTFSTYIYKCVDYSKLFKSQEFEIDTNETGTIIKRTIKNDFNYIINLFKNTNHAN